MSDKQWVDFAAVKKAVTIQMVLKHYGVNWLHKSGDELRGRCPIHHGAGERTFHANVAKNGFKCFSCGAKGNVLDLVAAMEKCTARDAALKLADWFGVGESAPAAAPNTRTVVPPSSDNATAAEACETASINRPLGFALKGIDPAHPYIKSREINEQTANVFGLGFFPGRGSMQGRVVIPIHNQAGELVAYAGRTIDGSEPKYKLPTGFHKSLELFNVHRAKERGRQVIVTEGFFDTIKVHQAGYPCVVALMGCSLSEEQERLLVENFDHVLVLLDGDEAGRQASREIGARLIHKLFVKVADVPEGKQPDQLPVEQLLTLVRVALR